MLGNRLFRLVVPVVLLGALSLTVGCDEDCEEQHTLCLAKIETSLDNFSYDVTCRYPSMNSGDARRYCECEDQYSKCQSE